MDTVRVEFEPWPPYSAEDICDKLMEVAEEFELKDRFEYWSHGGLIMNLPMTRESWLLCKKMRMYGGVSIFSSS